MPFSTEAVRPQSRYAQQDPNETKVSIGERRGAAGCARKHISCPLFIGWSQRTG